MKATLKAALFDLDGVVFDTEPQYTVFWGGECRRYHPEHPGLEQEIKGQTLDQIYQQWFDGPLESEQKAITERLNAYERQMDYIFVGGFEAFVADLRSHGVKTAVVTSSNMEKMEAVYRKRKNFTSLFDAILTSEDFDESKPSPDCYLKAAARFTAEPAECVVFEDSINGLRSGRSAQMLTIALTTTNPLEAVRGLSDIQIPDYNNINYNKLKEIWQDI